MRLFVTVFMIALPIFFGQTAGFAKDESITITTYYPSPMGIYNELKGKKLRVGDVSQAAPSENGQLQVDRSVIYNPQTSYDTIKALPNPKPGEVVYSAGDDTFFYYNGNAGDWVPQAGSGGGSGEYVGWGVKDCPETDQVNHKSIYVKAYEGYATVPISFATGASAYVSASMGNVICSAEKTTTGASIGWFWWTQGNETWTRPGEKYAMQCVVCVKKY